MENVIDVTFKEGSSDVVYTKKSFQHNRGVKLRISGVTLPEKYQVHFSNDEKIGPSVAIWISGNEIPIPNAFFKTGEYIHVWIFFAGVEDDHPVGATMYHAVIPIEKRPAILTVINSSGGAAIGADLDEETHTLIFHY